MSSITLDQRPAFCKFNSSHLIVSTYQLDSDSNSRSGALHLLYPDLSPFKIIPTPAGIFRFVTVDDLVCVSALTNGSLHICNLSDATFNIFNISEDMLLDVSIYDNQAAVTTNKGNISIIDYSSGKVVSTWLGHMLPYTKEPCEVWTTVLFENKLCTGGEDGNLSLWDARTCLKTGSSNIFGAGVTFAKWKDQNQIITGSYDQTIRILDDRNLSKPLKETETAGGVWHIESRGCGVRKQHLAACMYGGFALLDNEWNITYSSQQAGEELMYGVSFVDLFTIAYTTFNDYKVSTHVLPIVE